MSKVHFSPERPNIFTPCRNVTFLYSFVNSRRLEKRKEKGMEGKKETKGEQCPYSVKHLIFSFECGVTAKRSNLKSRVRLPKFSEYMLRTDIQKNSFFSGKHILEIFKKSISACQSVYFTPVLISHVS